MGDLRAIQGKLGGPGEKMDFSAVTAPSLAALPAGKNICQVGLIDENAQRFAFRRMEIALLP